MAQITQINPFVAGELIKAAELQADLNQLFTVINALDKDNLSRPGNVFSFGTTKVGDLIDPSGAWDDLTDLQVAATKAYLKATLLGKFPSASGNWHLHANKTILDAITNAGSGAIITTAERGQLPTQNQKDGLTNSPNPITGSNPVASQADLSGLSPAVSSPTFYTYGWSAGLAAGAFVNCGVLLNLTLKPHFRGMIRGRLYNGAVNGEGRINIVAGWDGSNVYLEFPDYTQPQMTMSDTSEAFVNATGDGGGVYPRVMVLSDAIPVEIGRNSSGTAGFSFTAIKSAGSPYVLFALGNGYAGTLPAKIDVLGYQK